MSDVDRYIRAATRDNTRKSYQAAVEHFEVEWGGFLPATADSLAEYLAHYAPTLAVSTLKQRLAGLAAWHQAQGFADPTKAPHVKKVMKGIAEIHRKPAVQAKPLQLQQLKMLVYYFDEQIDSADIPQRLQALRNKALFLLGFWRAFRSDELSRLVIEHIEIDQARGMTLYLPRTKSDRESQGSYYKVPALKQLCPVAAYQDWVTAAHLESGPVFSAINRWGHIAETPLHAASIAKLIKQCCAGANLQGAEGFSSHSLRRGFATWANQQGWNTKALMEYVGWRDVKSAMRYIETGNAFDQALLSR